MMTDTKHGFIITYFKSCSEAEKLLIDLIKTINKQNYYLVLASHSANVPLEVQQLCDFYFYQELNIVDDRKYSHGVAENNLIEIALLHLKYKKIEWTYKVCYDVVVKDVSRFKDWIQDYNYSFVSCNWGPNFLCTNSFFANVNFILDNISFYNTIEEMFAVNNVLENCWQKNIEDKNLKHEIYSYQDKQTFFGDNKIDTLYYNYNNFDFWFSPEESKFYITNNGPDFYGELRICDYYSDTCMYRSKDFQNGSGITMWIAPPGTHYLSKAKNGYYLEIDTKEVTIRKNILVKDFEYKDPLHKAFKRYKTEDIKYPEYCDFDELSMYEGIDIDIDQIKNFVDVGANFGFSSVPFIKRGIKTYMIDADQYNYSLLKENFDNNKNIKVIGHAISDIDGEISFYMEEGGSVVSSIFEINANGNNPSSRKKITVPSITPNNLIENYIDEDSVDFMKVDIEGAEYIFFETISDENIQKIDKILIEFHNNDNYEVLSILEKLTKNNFNYKLHNWGYFTDPFIVGNKMGVIYAWR
jgi:FkbM family methyltransferase